MRRSAGVTLRAAAVPRALEGAGRDLAGMRGEERTRRLVTTILSRRKDFGITRVGSVTRLDRIGLPVVQVVRPLSLSNAVSQGKGLTFVQAAASALMEELETWAGETIAPARLRTASVEVLGSQIRSLYAGLVVQGAPHDWDRLPLAWLDGWDLFTARTLPVPAALVDTVYTLPSPHPFVFPRTTTGLGAGTTMAAAIAQGAFEILERDAVAHAHRTPHFFDRYQIASASVAGGSSSEILKRLGAVGMLAGIWRVPALHRLPIYWCHVMEAEGREELAPLPAAGFACDLTHDRALARALLEACQSRLTAISGAREDITRHMYPQAYDRKHLAEWRRQLAEPAGAGDFARSDRRRQAKVAGLDHVLAALEAAGARAALVVPLLGDEDDGLHVVRVVAPPLRHGREG